MIFFVVSTISTLNFTAGIHTMLAWAIKISERDPVQLARVAILAKYLPWSKTVEQNHLFNTRECKCHHKNFTYS